MPASECNMACAEYLRLNQHYGAALRRWAQTIFVSKTIESYVPVRLRTLHERNAAKERMVLQSRIVRSATARANLKELSELVNHIVAGASQRSHRDSGELLNPSVRLNGVI